MADAPVLGAGTSVCGFKSHLPHQFMKGFNREGLDPFTILLIIVYAVQIILSSGIKEGRQILMESTYEIIDETNGKELYTVTYSETV